MHQAQGLDQFNTSLSVITGVIQELHCCLFSPTAPQHTRDFQGNGSPDWMQFPKGLSLPHRHFWRLHNTISDTMILFFGDLIYLFIYFLMKVNKGRGWRGILVMCKQEKSKRGVSQNCVLPLPKLLSNALPLVPTDKLVHPCMHADIWLSTALQCTSKSPSSDKLCKKDKRFNANPLNMIFIQLCTTCLWIKKHSIKEKGLIIWNWKKSQLYLFEFGCLNYSSVVPSASSRWALWDDLFW